MTATPFLTASQKAIARMVQDASGIKLSSYSRDDRAIARNKLLAMATKAPSTLSQKDYEKMMAGAKYKRTKDFLKSLADGLQDEVWMFL